jgi:hypothetical protein
VWSYSWRNTLSRFPGHIPRDPDFAATAARVLDLYARRFHDAPLRPDEYVISADEKTSIQARIRKHATTPRHRASLRA